MRALQPRNAPGGKRSDDVPLRVANLDEDPAEDDEILFHGLEGLLRRLGTPASMEILQRLAGRTLPVVEATLDGVVVTARAHEGFLKAGGPRCVLCGVPGASRIAVEVAIRCRSVQKGEKRKKR